MQFVDIVQFALRHVQVSVWKIFLNLELNKNKG